jgi:hypothetical protein
VVEVLFFSDREVKRKLFARVDRDGRPLLVVQVRQDAHARPPAEREPFATLERRFGAHLDVVLVADEGSAEGMWRDPVGDLADTLFPDDRAAAYAAASGYLLLRSGRPLAVVKKRGAAAEDLWFLQETLHAHLPAVPPPDPGERPGRKPQRARTGQHRASATRDLPPASMEAQDPWRVLGIAPGTPLPEAKKAYRALVAQYHPDKVSHLAPEFQQLADLRTRQILDAWRRLEEGEG